MRRTNKMYKNPTFLQLMKQLQRDYYFHQKTLLWYYYYSATTTTMLCVYVFQKEQIYFLSTPRKEIDAMLHTAL